MPLGNQTGLAAEASNRYGMRLRSLLLAATLLLTGLAALPASAAADPYAGYVAERSYVPTPHGDVYVQYWRPVKGKVPVLLSMSPYRYLYTRTDPAAPIKDTYAGQYLPQGIGRAYADLLGTGQSGGCFDYGGRAEAEAGAAVVEWLASRPWSTGRIAMIGTSFDGAIQLETAALAPEHLAAIVPQEPVSSWYDYNYDHAVSHMSDDEGQGGYPVGTPDLFDLVLGRTPNTDPDRSLEQRQRNLSERTDECETVEHNVRGHVVDPAYGPFWAERDWALRAHQVKAAVLFQHGWRDMNTKPNQFTRYWAGLQRSTSPDLRAFVGQWDHTDVFAAPRAGAPVDTRAYLGAFLRTHLKGTREPLLAATPKVLSQATDGRWRAGAPLAVHQTAQRLSAVAGSAFTNSGSESSGVFKNGQLGHPGTAAWTSAPMAKATRLVGSGTVRVRATSSGTRGHLDATLVDVAPDGSMSVVTLGLQDLRFRNDAEKPSALQPGTPFDVTVVLRPQDSVIAKGHRLALVIAGSEAVWGISDPQVGQTVTVSGTPRLQLPLVSA
ncbi:MAG: putative X-Pro dipeptidyl-peptidase [Frankiales bacterium]|nr:putative X-Pro dipeptidyl-peptidase [Frankiales bacterium]